MRSLLFLIRLQVGHKKTTTSPHTLKTITAKKIIILRIESLKTDVRTILLRDNQ